MLWVTGNKLTGITPQQTAGEKNIYFLIHDLVGNSLHLVEFTTANNASFLDTVCGYPYRNSGKISISENQNRIFKKHI